MPFALSMAEDHVDSPNVLPVSLSVNGIMQKLKGTFLMNSDQKLDYWQRNRQYILGWPCTYLSVSKFDIYAA